LGFIEDSIKTIISTLEGDIPKGDRVARYYIGEPQNPPMKYPAVYVQFSGRTYAGIADTGRFLYLFNFEVGILTRSVDEDKAELVNYQLIEDVETSLRANKGLFDGTSNLMIDTELNPYEITTIRASIEDHAMTKAIITVPYKQWRDG
jgi:hypothetical protein